MFPLLNRSSAPAVNSRAQFERVAMRKSELFLAEWLGACRAAAPEAKRGKSGPGVESLFDLVARTEWLPVVAPKGKVGRDFVSLCGKVARDWAGAIRIERAALRIAESLGRRAGPAGGLEPLGLDEVERLVRAGERSRLRALAGRYRGEPEEGLRAGELAIPGTRVIAGKSGELRAVRDLPGSRIGVGPALQGNAGRLRVGLERQGALAAGKLARALALVDAVWPEGACEIRTRTRLILTLDEPGLVSYSHLHRPGVSYINLRGKSVFDLADDLLHETAHHRLHAVEDRTPLVRAARGEEKRYWSPWRRAMRPVRGIVHAAYTFSFRAELLERLLAACRANGGRVGPTRASPARIAWLRREAAAERRHLKQAVAQLKDAAGRGLLTARGRRLTAEIEACGRPRRGGSSPA